MINSSCTNEDLVSSVENEFVFLSEENAEKFFSRPGTGESIPAEIFLVYHGQDQNREVNYSFEILESSTAIEGTHFVLDGTSGSFNTENIKAELPISIIPDNLISCQDVTIDIRLISSDIDDTNGGTVTFSLGVEGGSELAGEVTYSHTNNFAGSEINGIANIIASSAPGLYTVDDFSFGSWGEAYNIDPPTGNLLWSNNCSTIVLSGTDNFGETWEFTEVSVSNGPEFTFTWSNTYGEFGTVTLTRSDGKNWPFLEL